VVEIARTSAPKLKTVFIARSLRQLPGRFGTPKSRLLGGNRRRLRTRPASGVLRFEDRIVRSHPARRAADMAVSQVSRGTEFWLRGLFTYPRSDRLARQRLFPHQFRAATRADSGRVDAQSHGCHARPCAGHPRLALSVRQRKTWVAGTSPAMTHRVNSGKRSRR